MVSGPAQTGLCPDALAAGLADGPAMRVVVACVKGSAPREVGASMMVSAHGFTGTIGGGALEWQALEEARALLASGVPGASRGYPLGPALGQCCGGAVTLAYERWESADIPESGAHARPILPGAPPEAPAAIRAHARALRAGEGAALVLSEGWLSETIAPARIPLFLYGAGHVGRAVVRVFEGLPFAITWIDSGPERFPADAAHGARILPAANPADAVALAPAGAVHMALTYSHALDLEICARVLARGDFARAGVIGSASKSARFRSRLRALGIPDAAIARLECPIGAPGLGGKPPAQIAVSLAAELLAWSAGARVEIRPAEDQEPKESRA
ncbi:xanthine dehydrogenase accessory protein XdhC [Rhodovulum sp. DZ06]|uniref:xanthine dehydrogenase accessory protein XdhC n=1 Tax=Rhodovulum sp. DZ06 TaxID=3425126 RepID=UPI003D32F8B0